MNDTRRAHLILIVICVHFICLFSNANAQSQNIDITVNGRTYHNCRYLRQDADGVSFAHDNGIAKFSLSELPPNIRSKYPDVPKPVPAVVSTPSYIAPVREPIVIQQPTAQAPNIITPIRRHRFHNLRSLHMSRRQRTRPDFSGSPNKRAKNLNLFSSRRQRNLSHTLNAPQIR